MTSHLLESDVMNACRVLFGPAPYIDKGFLNNLQPSGAKSAYRKKAKETHPDFFYTEDHSVQQQKTALFRSLLEAYDIITRFFNERDKGLWRLTRKPAVWTSRRNTGASRPSAGKQGSGYYYEGTVPRRVLELGRYLFYSRHISYEKLIAALTWQRLQRPVIGSIAQQWGWLAETAVAQIIMTSAVPGRFGEKAVRLGLLSDLQVGRLLRFQRAQQERLGTYFIKNDILTSDQLDHFVQKMQEHNARIMASKKAA